MEDVVKKKKRNKFFYFIYPFQNNICKIKKKQIKK